MSKKTFKILSIDGGGILGLYSANILSRIEKEFFNGEPLSSHFDLITGTSTGGIIALALATGLKAEIVQDFYIEYANMIFPKKRQKRMGILKSKYSNEQLKNGLIKCFGDKKIKDCKTLVCIPSINVATCTPLVFKTNNDGMLNRDEECKLIDIALATSAAPLYFPIHSFDSYQGLVDGGLWQNNPSLIGIIEALSYFVGDGKKFDNMSILSIGNPSSSIKHSINTKNKKSGIIKWKDKIVTLPMQVNSIGTDYIIKILQRLNAAYIHKYERIDCGVLPNDYSKLKMDSSDNYSLDRLLELSYQDFNNKKIDLSKFFKEDL